MATTYTATVTREDDLWVVEIDGLPQNVSSAADYESLPELFEDTPELIADLTDTDPDDFSIEWRLMAGEVDVTDSLLLVQALAILVEDLPHLLDRARRSLLTMLSRADWSQREMGEVVGLSHQRVQQILTGAKSHPEKSTRASRHTALTGLYIPSRLGSSQTSVTNATDRPMRNVWISGLPSRGRLASESQERHVDPTPHDECITLLELVDATIRQITDDPANQASDLCDAT